MSYIRTLMLIIAATAAASACRPSSQDNYLFDASTDQVEIQVTDQSKRIALRAPAGKKLTKLNQLALSKDVTGTVTPNGKTFVNLHKDETKLAYDVEITMDANNLCKSTSSSGVALNNGGKFNVSCVPGPALTDQIKLACKELATDAAVAEYDETTETCNCLKRTDKLLKYADYAGKVSLFKIECKNSGTAENLKTVCTDIKDRQCPTCKVEADSCECPSKAKLSYDKYLTNIEGFRKDCGLLKTPTSPVTADAEHAAFSKACKENNGTFVTSSSGNEKAVCICQKDSDTPSVVTWSEYKEGGSEAISKLCIKPSP